ncbi:MAG: nucleotidyltransferase domain-containing protein [Magnetococcus sp. DMHC-1]|nr:nucleotidyltransferase domain-containing protein [Magnetococcales bacterium]MBF0423796.1 nucleotidyltransferase domain-containing protein [Magnetococcales bacterium]
MVDSAIGTSVEHYLTELIRRGLPVEFGVLFGSHARGTPHKWSDIDLVVVSPQFDQKRLRSDINLLWHTATTTDSRIEPIAVGSRQWIEDDGIPIIEIARREGKIIRPPNTPPA